MATEVFRYDCYREFLKDYIDEKRHSKNLSFRYFALKCGFKRPNYLQAIIKGERRLTAKSAATVAKGLNLDTSDRRIFCTLVACTEAKDSSTSEALKKQLLHLKAQRFMPKVDGSQVIQSYILPIIWEMFRWSHKESWTFDELRRSIRLESFTAHDLDTALISLKRCDLISQNAEGAYVKQKDGLLINPQDVSNEVPPEFRTPS